MNTVRESPLILFGAQSGAPTESDIARTLESARAAGFSDYMVYARSGLGIEYMGGEWLDLAERYLRHARRLGMGIWLYDDFNWPSGSCNGRVTAANPAFRNAVCSVCRRPGGDGFDWRVMPSPDNSANVFDAEAMALFRALTHEAYERRFRDDFGSVIRGVFCDEPGSCWWRDAPPGSIVSFRWHRNLERDYRDETGRDFRADVEEWCHGGESAGPRVWEDFTAVLGHAFRRAFIDPTRKWADRLGILSGGHLMDESEPRAAALANGLVLHALKGMSIPGIDDIFTRVAAGDSPEWLTLASAQHAAARTGRGAIAELFALGPGDLPFDAMRQQLWLHAFHKVDRYLLALHFVSPHGFLEKPHYAMFFSPLQPWFDKCGILHGAAREAAAFSRRPFLFDAAARYRQKAAGAAAVAKAPFRDDLVALLREFGSRQLAVDLLDEDEPTDSRLVFDFDASGIFEEREGRRFADAAAALDFAMAVNPPPSLAFEADGGEPARDLAVRRHGDGTAALLNLRAGARSLVFATPGGARIPVALPARGVWLHRPVAGEWSLALDRGNRRRIRFLADGTARIRPRVPVTCRFALCAIVGAEAAISLDGTPLDATLPCSFLGYGYDAAYRETGPVALSSGVHVFVASGRDDRGLFLPLLWMEGAFAAETEAPDAPCGGAAICPIPGRVPCAPLAAIGLGDFAGKASWSADVSVPADASAIEIGTGRAVASVRLGGHDLGTRGFAPWRYAVPPALRGTRATLRITISTSIRPVFGTESDDVAGAIPSGRPDWVRTVPGERRTGLEWARWCGEDEA